MSEKQNRRKKSVKIQENREMVFQKQNYVLLGIAVLCLAIGFGGMYIENEFTGWFSLYISPLFLVGGFITVAVAILWKKDSVKSETESING
jgi:hypothetical protein